MKEEFNHKHFNYKWTKGFLLAIFITLILLIGTAYGQVNYTNNLNDNNWSNGYPVNSLDCWKGGDPNCSPGTPYVRPTGDINFSYNYTELYQARSIASVLPNSGTGLMVTGFKFDWTSKNGNGWDDGRLDQLKAYVQLYSTSGKWIENMNYDLNFVHNWTSFSWNGNFSQERRGSDLGTILYGFAGKDNNFWMGPYGPEINNVNFQLRYQPDPCVVNPLHSVQCPKFLDTINTMTALNYSGLATNDTSSLIPDTSKSVITNETYDISQQLKSNVSIVFNTINKNKQQQHRIEINTLKEERNSTFKVMRDAEQLSTEKDNNNITSSETPLVVSSVNSLSSNTNQMNDRKTTVESNTNVLQVSNVKSINLLSDKNELNVIQNSNEEFSTTLTSESYQLLRPQQSQNIQQEVQIQIEQPIQSVVIPPIVIPEIQVTEPVIATTQINEPPQQVKQEIVLPAPITQVELTQTASNFTTDRTNPVNEIIENKQTLESERKEFIQTTSVNRSTQNNEVAGGIGIESIATQPAGFNQYASLVLRDAVFYAPKEIYRSQKTVDNARALRQLASDRLHQEMVNQQYLPR